MIEAVAVLAMIWIAISAVYLLKNKSTPVEDKYIWIGPGEDPFSK